METYNGHVKTPADAIILFEACRIGLLPRVQRRLSEKERQQIKSGSVFVWDEREAGMRRWTDGKSWSASRVSGSFLTYREMEGKRGGNGYATVPQPQKKPSPKVDARSGDSEEEGPDGYRYKPDGLMKQSFSITTSSGQHLHLISYYARSSPSASNLLQPSTDPNLRHIRPPKNMYPESTVNDPQVNMPAVTRAPMASPGFSAGSPQPNAGSPYQRAPMGPTYIPQQPGWPPTPSATPPGTYAIYYPYGPPPPGHAPPMHFQPIHHAYPPHVGPPPTHLDRVPPPISNSQVPPAPQHHHPSSQPYPHSFTTRAPQTSYPAPHHYPHTTEPGPQLPPVGAHAGSDHHSSNRPSSGGRPQPSSLNGTEGHANTSSASPARIGPVTSLSSILNSAPHNTGPSADQSRQGSQSPANTPYARKMNESTAPLRAANQAINALNSAALST